VALVAYTWSGSEGTLHADSLFQLVVGSLARGKNELEMIVHETMPESRTIQHVMHTAMNWIKRPWSIAHVRDRVGSGQEFEVRSSMRFVQ
jgi:hypothetical protein